MEPNWWETVLNTGANLYGSKLNSDAVSANAEANAKQIGGIVKIFGLIAALIVVLKVVFK